MDFLSRTFEAGKEDPGFCDLWLERMISMYALYRLRVFCINPTSKVELCGYYQGLSVPYDLYHKSIAFLVERLSQTSLYILFRSSVPTH
jgi:hypothetical protein